MSRLSVGFGTNLSLGLKLFTGIVTGLLHNPIIVSNVIYDPELTIDAKKCR